MVPGRTPNRPKGCVLFDRSGIKFILVMLYTEWCVLHVLRGAFMHVLSRGVLTMYVLSSHSNVELRHIKIKEDMDALNNLFSETMGSDSHNFEFYQQLHKRRAVHAR